jgi:ABC-type multidrug transport system permease subunit
MVVTELHDLPVVCKADEYNTFAIPDNETCRSYAGKWIDQSIGYIRDLDATGSCDYCAYSVGDQFYESLGISFDNRWRDLGIFIAFVGSNLIIIFLAVSNLVILGNLNMD